jgi:hypothetical protein
MVFLVLKLKKIESERLFIPQGGRSRLPTFVKCASAGFCPTCVVKKGPQVATLSRGRVFINISKIFSSQTMKLGHPNTNLYSHIQYTIFENFILMEVHVGAGQYSILHLAQDWSTTERRAE